MRVLMSRWVELSGHHVATAENADKALEVLADQAPDVAVCDIRMPGHDGLWLAERIRRDFPDTAVIIATSARDTDPRVAEHNGAVDYLVKPFGRDRLRFALERGFDWHQTAASRREWLKQLSGEMGERHSELVERLAQIEGSESPVDELLAVIEEFDPAALLHARRVAAMSLGIGHALGLSDADLAIIRKAALLHDLGKLELPQAVLGKPAALTPEEKEIIRKLPAIGAGLLKAIRGMEAVSTIINSSKEWYDGHGYPHALAGDAIPLGGRIVAVADAFDAMTRNQIYRDALPSSEALREILRCSNSQFDPLVVSSLLAVLGEHASKQ